MKNNLLRYLFQKRSLFKAAHLMQNSLLGSFFLKKQLIQSSLSYAKQLITISF